MRKICIMEPLLIQGDEITPAVNFDPKTGILEMKGVAIPEDVRETFDPIKLWLEEYVANPPGATQLIFYFDYLNTAASKMIYVICEKVCELYGNKDCKVKIVWKYNRGDHEMLELGEEILEPFACLKDIVAVDHHF